MLNERSRVSRPAAPVSPLLRPLSRGYALQIGLATLFIAAALILARGAELPVVAAIGSSAFLVFCLPTSPMASPRNVVGGYAGALVIAAGLDPLVEAMASDLLHDLLAAGAVGLSLLLMALTKTEHVPAAGAVLALSLHWDVEAAASMLLMALVLAVAHTVLRGRPLKTL
ncbi:MAG: HPP family protein [Dehalococcoidia bacterium]